MRAFVIGNGISLRDTPMDRLRGEFTIGMNRLYMLGLEWDPSWWILADVSTADVWDWPFMAARKSHMLVRWHERELIEPYRTSDIEYFEYCEHGNHNLPTSWHLPQICKYGGGISIGMQTAARLGYNPIYLVGCDLYKYRPPGPDINHFHEEYSRYKVRKTGEEINPPEAYPRLNSMLVSAHTIARDSADSIGVSIFNATVGGMLEVYPRADIWKITR